MNILFKIVLYSALLYGISFIVQGVTLDVFWPTAVIAGLVFYIANTVVKPIIKILTLPITILTLGLFMIVINAVMFLGTAYVVEGFEVASWYAAVVGGIVASIGSWLISMIMDNE